MGDLGNTSSNLESGPAIDRLAAEFGISTDEANAAVDALMPAIAAGVRAKASDPAGFLSLLGLPGAARPLAAFGDPTSLPISDAERDALVARAAGTTGLAPDLLSKMLPVIGSLVVSAIVSYVQSRGLGGLGSILGQVLGGGRAEASPVPPQGAPSGPGGIDLGSILEQIIRGGGGASPVPPQGAPSGPGGIDLGSILEQVIRGGGGGSPVPPQGAPSGPAGIDLGSILEQVIRGGGGSPVPPQGAPSGPDGIDFGSILEQVIRGGRGQESPPRPGEPERPRGGLEDEIGKILRGSRD